MTSFVYTYKTIINAPIDNVWSFFSSATNLSKITPFPKVEIISDPRTITGNRIKMKLGYAGFNVRWISLIEDVQEPNRFVDTAVKLPFPFVEWSHIHTFTPNGNETIMQDQVHLRSFLPSVFLKPLLNSMFKGREQAIRLHFLT
ncbi:SRPBCC family protein [Halalkalibacter alkalisediminis]|uniref:SRPBCC family protein n=1 Tax=Halalkalibacter alkalisediminis TaxID=935616 RepID=A0ABV6NBJ1_9BACI|nr:SRPBCC family protein [Halalkalibacter alkalisediminis]